MSRWKIIAGGTLLIISGIAAFEIWVHGVAARRWVEMEAAVRELRTQMEARSGERPVLRGEAEPGDAWVDYSAAIQAMGFVEGYDAAFSDVYTWLEGRSDDRSKAVAYLESRRTALELFRHGASRTHGQATVDWGGRDGPADPRISRVLQLAEGQLRLDVERDDPIACLALCLDLAQVGGDVARNGDLFSGLYGLNFMRVAFQGVRDLLLGGRLGAADVARLAEALDRMDTSFPDLQVIAANETMAMGVKLIASRSIAEFRRAFGAHEHGEPPGPWLKRAVLPDRLLMADAFFLEWELRRREIAALALPWPTARAELRSIENEFVEGGRVFRPVHGSLGRAHGSVPRRFHQCRVYLRLLRAAARYIGTGETPNLSDPFGARLPFREKQGGVLRVWSVGPDGVDDGGDSTNEEPWKPAPDTGKRSPDLVLEVELTK